MINFKNKTLEIRSYFKQERGGLTKQVINSRKKSECIPCVKRKDSWILFLIRSYWLLIKEELQNVINHFH